MANKWIRSEILEIIIYIAIGIGLVGILPYFGGLVLRGFEPEIAGEVPFSVANYLGGYLIYTVPFIIALAVIIFPIVRLIALPRSEHPATQEKPKWWTIFSVSLIHAPEENGALYRLFHYLKADKFMKWNLSIFRMLMLSILVFGLYGLLTLSYPQLAIASVPDTQQQVTVVSDVIFGAAVPSFAENGLLLFIFLILLGLNAWVCSRFRLGLAGFFVIAYLFICPLMGFAWTNIHNIVYPNSDIRRVATFTFGTVGAALTLTFASFLPWLIWHISNNGFIRLNELVTVKADIYFISILIWIALFVLYVTGEIIAYRFRKGKEEKVVVPT